MTQSSSSTPDLSVISRRGVLGLGLGLGASAVVGVLPASAAETVLNYTWKQQNTQSWCSAASSRIALSAVLSQPPTQATLASQLGLVGGSGLQDPTLIAKVLNSHIGAAGGSYVFRIAPAGELKTRLRTRVKESIGRGYPVVINMNQVGSSTYSAGHYIAIVGYRAGEYLISDPDSEARRRAWFSDDSIVAWNKLNRFTAFV